MKYFSIVVAVLALALPTFAEAKDIVAKDPQTIAQFFDEEGVAYDVTTDDVGDPNISVNYYGNEFSIYFYGCTDNTRCDAIQFFSGYQTDGSVRLSKINDWNTENRFGRAYVSDEGSARIELDVFLGNDGMSADDFAELLGIWSRLVQDFETLIDW
ncbi:YbjN domain-containing protein [Phaeobacter sp.]|uniref:YbjN domain-containing protein n=1 Tax=Phaeobacter sp. TaxID=1902409 RepID=UPI0025F4A203|nr:YbjN domain-containing protein [Phaeobacter sp.]